MYNGDLPLGDIVWLCVVLISLGAEWTERLDIALPNTISPPDSLPNADPGHACNPWRMRKRDINSERKRKDFISTFRSGIND